ncbi:MAG: acyclic terpene utilization AtuA family protein, partial [Pseudomonadales bacterium]|nr:acyclic terpene utilization AtuA family protein [Pseudomonadales bacterium]
VAADGTFICTKPDNTGGIVNIGTVAEQMLYEIGDPQAYFLPDVVCDFSTAVLEQVAENRVRVSGATGQPAPDAYKVCGTYNDKFRGGVYLSMYGAEANLRAEALSAAVLRTASRELQRRSLGEFAETSVEIMGNESQYGAFRQIEQSREVIAKVAAKHEQAAGIGVLLKAAAGLGLATPPGLSGFQGGRPKPSPVVRLFSFTLPKAALTPSIEVDGKLEVCPQPAGQAFDTNTIVRPDEPLVASATKAGSRVALQQLAWVRSGDKGNKANIGVIARKPEYLPYIYAALTEAVVADRFAHFLEKSDAVERYLLPGSHAINFLLHDVLGGGGIASLRNDPQAKGYGQLLLEIEIPVPDTIAAQVQD